MNCQNQKLGNVFRDDLRELLETQFYPKLEKLLHTYDDEENVWYIEHVPVELHKLNARHWKTDFIEKSMQQIERYLRNQMLKIPMPEVASSETRSVRKILKKNTPRNYFYSFWKQVFWRQTY